MGCSSCGTSSGKPSGCKSNGGCSTGGCNRLNVHDWLMNLPFHDPEGSCKVVEVSFNQGSRKEFYRNATLQYFSKGELVTVEGAGGFDVGEVSLAGELVRLQLKKRGVDEFLPDMKKILRKSNERDIELMQNTKEREQDILIRSRAIARSIGLQMKISEVELQADGKKATFFYTADDRVDFRELIRVYANDFKVKVEMKQIGIRQEAAKVGGIGSCGRELCCSTWLSDFKSVNTTAARYQNLSINQTKLSGQCGRLKCCLNFELDTYLDALQHFPDHADQLQTAKGTAHLIKKDIFKNLMWYVLPGSTQHYPLTIQRVKEIQRLNRDGIRPDELEAVEVVSSKPREVEPEFVDVVGQISLRSLDRNDRKRRDQQRQQQRPQQGQPPRRPSGGPQQQQDRRPGQPDNRRPQGNRPQGNGPQPPRPGNQPDRRTGGGGQNRGGGQQGPRRQGPPQRPQPPSGGAE